MGDIVPEALFRAIAIRELDYPWPDHDVERQLTEIRASWTDKFLYLHVWAKDSWVTAEDKIHLVLRRGDRSQVWEATAAGTVTSYQAWGQGGETTFDRSWKTTAQSKIRLHDAGWVWEMRIPFAKDLGDVPARGDSWRAGVFRTDVDRRGRTSLSAFAEAPGPGEPDFHQPEILAQLIFG